MRYSGAVRYFSQGRGKRHARAVDRGRAKPNVKTTVKGAPSGKLAGKTVVLKDNVCLAGVPMMNGASTLEG
jgi:Asp-tRNA(Asn)/Glu-tRNA(Gln) amidotransferase A subunit family amidase